MTTPLYMKKGRHLLTHHDGKERVWDPTTSKLAAALFNGLVHFRLERTSAVLYLGASTGTTVSHLSDMIGDGNDGDRGGIIYAIEFSERVFRSLVSLAAERTNIAPLLMDARLPERYAWIEQCDLLVADVAQPDQTDIAVRNATMFLKPAGTLLLSVKSQSIDVTKARQVVYEEERQKLEAAGFRVLQTVDLEPFEQKHALIAARKS